MFRSGMPRVMRALACGLAVVLSLYAKSMHSQMTGYDQPYRPQVHFSPREHWTNDPNGLIYFHGEYHLFYQYNPFGDVWGHMSWGHAVSTDLLHWQELAVAIPEHDGVMIFTGSIVVDRENTSGLCSPKIECMVAIYTGSSNTPQGPRQNQNLAYSQDAGRTWIQYAANPVLDLHLADFRDPSVSWDEKDHHWIMAVSLPKQHKVRLYASSNLKQWTWMSEFGPAGDVIGDWECPDLLHIPDAAGSSGMWALKVGLNPGAPQGGSGEQYFLGSFDGKTFTQSADQGSQGWTNYGKDDYCAISYNGLPTGQKPLLIGWMSNWQYAAKLPTSPWRGQMSLPRRLSLLKDSAGLALKQEPVVAPLDAGGTTLSVSSGGDLRGSKLAVEETPYELELEFGNSSEQTFGIRLYSDRQHWSEIGFDRQKGEFYIDRIHSGLQVASDFPARTTAPLVASRPFDLKLVVDRSSLEAYAQSGTIAMTDLTFAPSQTDQVELFSSSGKAVPVSGKVRKLHSIWK